MLRTLALTIHPEKSVLKPTQILIYLGFDKSKPTIRFAAHVIGNIASQLCH